MKKFCLILLSIVFLSSCGLKKDNHSQYDKEKDRELAKGMQLLNFSKEENLKIQSDFNSFQEGKKIIFHDGWYYLSRKREGGNAGAPLEVGELYKMSGDGNEIIKLSDDSASSLVIEGDYLYYSNNSDFGYPYRIKTDGTGREKVCDYRMSDFLIDGDWIFFSGLNLPPTYEHVSNPPISYLGRVKLDGSGFKKIFDDDCWYLFKDDKYLYGCYIDMNSVYFDRALLYYSLEDLRKENPPKDIRLLKMEDVDAPLAILQDGSIIAERVDMREYKPENQYLERIYKDGSTEQIKKLTAFDDLFNIYEGKIYTVRRISDKERKIRALYVKDEKGEEELLRYHIDKIEPSPLKMIGNKVFCSTSEWEDLYVFDIETKEMKQIFDRYKPMKLEEAEVAIKELGKIKNVLKEYESRGMIKEGVLEYYSPVLFAGDVGKNAYSKEHSEKNWALLLDNIGIMAYPDGERDFIPIQKLIDYTAEDLVNAKVIKADIDLQLLYFQYFEKLIKSM